MFPPELWKEISREAIDLINKLLRVEVRGLIRVSEECLHSQIEERLPIEECMAHPWLQDSQLLSDMRDLEALQGTNYLSAGYGTPEQGMYGMSAQNSSNYDGDNSLI